MFSKFWETYRVRNEVRGIVSIGADSLLFTTDNFGFSKLSLASLTSWTFRASFRQVSNVISFSNFQFVCILIEPINRTVRFLVELAELLRPIRQIGVQFGGAAVLLQFRFAFVHTGQMKENVLNRCLQKNEDQMPDHQRDGQTEKCLLQQVQHCNPKQISTTADVVPQVNELAHDDREAQPGERYPDGGAQEALANLWLFERK